MSHRPGVLAVICGLLLVGCSSDLPSRPDAHRPPSTTTTTTTTSTTTTTTTTLPPVVVPGPVKLGTVCIVPGGISTTADNVRVYCIDRKGPDAKPFAGGKLRWVAATA